MKTKPPSHMSYEGSALHFLRKRRNKKWQDCHSSQQVNSGVLDGFRRCKGNFRLFPCTVKTDVRRDALSLDVIKFQAQNCKVIDTPCRSGVKMLDWLDNDTVNAEGLDLSGHDVWMSWFGWLTCLQIQRAVLYRSVNLIRMCVDEISFLSITSLLQPTRPDSRRATFSAVLTRFTPSSTVRACSLLTVTSALPVCFMLFQITW